MMKQTKTKGKIPFQTIAEITNKSQESKSLLLPAIVTAAVAICAMSCNDSAGSDEESTLYKTTQPVLRFHVAPDGTQTVTEEDVQSNLPDPRIHMVQQDQNGKRWIKIQHDAVPFADGSKDTTGLLAQYAWLDLDRNQLVPQERFESEKHKLQQTSDAVYWHAASPYSFDGFWTKKPVGNKEEAMDIHQNSINGFMVQAKATPNGASGSWAGDSTETAPVHSANGGGGHYVFVRGYYPYAYDNYASSPVSNNALRHNSLHGNSMFSRTAKTNVFRNHGMHMSRLTSGRTAHFTTVRSPTVRGHFSSRGGFSFGG